MGINIFRYLFKFWSKRIVSDLQNVRNEFVCYYTVGHFEGSLSCDGHVMTRSCKSHVTYLPEIIYSSQVRIINNLRRKRRRKREEEEKEKKRGRKEEDTCTYIKHVHVPYV